jgi:hypothetical protein
VENLGGLGISVGGEKMAKTSGVEIFNPSHGIEGVSEKVHLQVAGGALLDVGGVPRLEPVLAGNVTQDRLGLPQDKPLIILRAHVSLTNHPAVRLIVWFATAGRETAKHAAISPHNARCAGYVENTKHAMVDEQQQDRTMVGMQCMGFIFTNSALMFWPSKRLQTTNSHSTPASAQRPARIQRVTALRTAATGSGNSTRTDDGEDVGG